MEGGCSGSERDEFRSGCGCDRKTVRHLRRDARNVFGCGFPQRVRPVRQRQDQPRRIYREYGAWRFRGLSYAAVPLPQGVWPRRTEHDELVGRRRCPDARGLSRDDIPNFRMRVISVETPTHGRALIKDAAAAASRTRLLVGFHGYAQRAEDMLSQFELIPGSERWTLVAIQALHRFYSRGQENVVASWMTREDRELAIEDNLTYVNRVLGAVLDDARETRMVFIGFSQGVGMAYRAALLGLHRPRFVIAVGGDVP